MTEQRKKPPSLRFKNFTDSWKPKRLSDLLEFKNGINASKEQYGRGVKFINVLDILNNDYITHDSIIGSVDVDENIAAKYPVNYGDILFQRSSETREEVGTACVYLDSRPATFGGFVIRGRKIGEYDPIFLNKLLKTDLSRNEITSKSGGSTRYNVGQETLSSIALPFPSLPEQQKIASFLSAVDEKIQHLTRKKELLTEYKKGVMQQLFSGKLRFKDEKGKAFPEWEEKRLGDVLDYIQPTKYLVSSTEYDDSYKTPVLTAGKTFILGYTNETNNIYSENFPVILFDDFTTATQIVDFPFKAKSSAMKILVAKKGENINFIYEAMSLIKFEIGGHGRHWISQYALFNIPYPHIAEQKKISHYLSSLDTKIEIVNNQITHTQIFKKGLLQQMFV